MTFLIGGDGGQGLWRAPSLPPDGLGYRLAALRTWQPAKAALLPVGPVAMSAGISRRRFQPINDGRLAQR
jgi:hypothetical protein